MLGRRRLALVLALAAVLLAVPAVALAASRLTAARYGAPDGTIFKVTADRSPTAARLARFALRITPPVGATSPYGAAEHVTTADLRRAGTNVPLRVGSALACADPGVSTAYGTVIRRAKRVTATLQDGTRLRLSRTEPPAAWGLHGWVVAGIANSHSPVVEVDASDTHGKRVAYAKFQNVSGC
jgi:hypothetical protein